MKSAVCSPSLFLLNLLSTASVYLATAVEYVFGLDDQYLRSNVALDVRRGFQGENILYGQVSVDFSVDFGVGGDDIALNAGLLADDYFPGTFDIPLQ